jgi:rubrerythrin
MLTARSIFREIRGNDRAYRLLLSVAAKGETQGGWENARIALLTGDPELAAKIRRHGEDESKHGRLFATLLKKRGLSPVEVPADADYCMLLERQGIGLAHQRLRRDEPLADEDIIRYLAHRAEQRSTEEINLQLAMFGDDPELKRALAMIADDEANHLSYCHEELLRLCAQGHRTLIERMLKGLRACRNPGLSPGQPALRR